MAEYLLDFTATGCARLSGNDLASVVAAFRDFLDYHSAGIVLPGNDGVTGEITELSLGVGSQEQPILALAEVDGESGGEGIELDTMMTPVVCDRFDDGDPDCEQVYDEARGDGYMGLCPHHADVTEDEELN